MTGSDQAAESSGAGRIDRPSPWLQGGESESEALVRFAAELAVQRSVQEIPLFGAEGAQESYARFLRDQLAPSLHDLGFRGSGSHYFIDRDAFRGNLDIQKSRHNTKAAVEFTFNLSAVHNPTDQSLVESPRVVYEQVS